MQHLLALLAKNTAFELSDLRAEHRWTEHWNRSSAVHFSPVPPSSPSHCLCNWLSQTQPLPLPIASTLQCCAQPFSTYHSDCSGCYDCHALAWPSEQETRHFTCPDSTASCPRFMSSVRWPHRLLMGLNYLHPKWASGLHGTKQHHQLGFCGLCSARLGLVWGLQFLAAPVWLLYGPQACEQVLLIQVKLTKCGRLRCSIQAISSELLCSHGCLSIHGIKSLSWVLCCYQFPWWFRRNSGN